MFQDYFTGSRHVIWSLLGLLIFGAIFIGVIAYVIFGMRDPDKRHKIATLPLAHDDQPNDEQSSDKPAEGESGP